MSTNLLRRCLIVALLAFSVVAISNTVFADGPTADPPYPHPVLDPNVGTYRSPYPQLNPDGTNADTLPRDTRLDSLDNRGATPLCIPGPYGCWTPSLCDDISDLGHQQNDHRCHRTTYYLCRSGIEPECTKCGPTFEPPGCCCNPNACGVNPFTTSDIVAVCTRQYPKCQGTFSVISPGGGLWGYFPNRDVDGYQEWNWVDILNHNIGDFNWLKLQ